MFSSDKDLARGSKRGGASSSREEVLAKAKADRETRERNRATAAQVLTLQRFFRGRHAAAVHRGALRAEYDRKMGDVVTLKRVLANQGVPFALPTAVAATLLAQLLYFYTPLLPADRDRLQSFCEDALLPAMRSADARLHVPAALAAGDAAQQLRLRRLLLACLDHTAFTAMSAVAASSAAAGPLQASAMQLLQSLHFKELLRIALIQHSIDATLNALNVIDAGVPTAARVQQHSRY
jgi:hypothetical protein